MNCLDFRRRWLTVPYAGDLALAQHERVCSGCRQFARRGLVFERRLREAVSVEAPPGLTERIRQRRDIGEMVHKHQARPLRYAVMISLVLAAALVSLLAYDFLAPDPREAEFHRVAEHLSLFPAGARKDMLQESGAGEHGGDHTIVPGS